MDINKETMIKVGLIAAMVVIGGSITMIIRSRSKRQVQLASQQMIMKKQEPRYL